MAIIVAMLFFDHIFELHELPESIVSDRDVNFTSLFWDELFAVCGTKLAFSFIYCPQSDSQAEVVNRKVEIYLHCFTCDHPTQWVQ